MIIHEHRFFWRQHPALLYALTLLIGVGGALFWQEPWSYLFPTFWSFYLIWMKKWPILILLPAMIAYSYFLYKNVPAPGFTQGIFSIATLQPHQSPFTKGFIYKGTLYTTQGSIPCDIYTHGFEPLQKADCNYLVSGKLEQRGAYQYIFKAKNWMRIENTWSFAEWRYLAKERYRQFLREKCHSHPRAALFFAALTTGDVDDRMLKYEFNRLGLQHLLAISGFHFGVLIAFASFVLSLFLPRFWKLLLLLLSLSLYYFFVGPFPAIQRSWLAAIAYLTGKLIKRQTSGLNLLGFALGVEVVSNPLIISNLGFQFSFVSTAGILLLHPLFEEKLCAILPKRPPREIMALSLFSKHAYLLSSFLRHAFALTLSVTVAILPILLVHFRVFPLLSLLYNLFFPFAVGIALSALLFALSLQLLVPSLASLIFGATSWFTAKLLDLTAYPPLTLDYPLLVPYFPSAAIPFYLFFILLQRKLGLLRFCRLLNKNSWNHFVVKFKFFLRLSYVK